MVGVVRKYIYHAGQSKHNCLACKSKIADVARERWCHIWSWGAVICNRPTTYVAHYIFLQCGWFLTILHALGFLILILYFLSGSCNLFCFKLKMSYQLYNKLFWHFTYNGQIRRTVDTTIWWVLWMAQESRACLQIMQNKGASNSYSLEVNWRSICSVLAAQRWCKLGQDKVRFV